MYFGGGPLNIIFKPNFYRNYYKNNRNNRNNKKPILIGFIVMLLLIPFQNCSNKGFQTDSAVTGTTVSNSMSLDQDNPTSNDETQTSNTTPDTTAQDPVAVVDPAGLPQPTTPPPSSSSSSTVPVDPAAAAAAAAKEAARQERCFANIQKPIIANAAALNNTVFNLNSGLDKGSGDLDSTLQDIQVDNSRGVIDTSLSTPISANGDGCTYVTSVRMTAVDPATDATHTASVTHGINLTGLSVVSASMNIFNVAKSVVASTPNNNNSSFAAASNSLKIGFTIVNNQNRAVRCAAGSLYYKVQIRVQTTGLNKNNTLDSDPVFVKAQFSNSCWAESKLLAATAYPKAATVGGRVVVNGNWAAALASRDNNTGAVYLFSKSNNAWSFSQRLVMPDASAGDALSHLDLKDNYLAVSNSSFGGQGKVYIFILQNGSWVYSQSLMPPENIADQKFGLGMAFGTNELAIGSPDHPRSGTDTGRVYIFNLANGAFAYSQSYLDGVNVGTDLAHYSFGSVIAYNGNKIAIGAPSLMGSDYPGRVFIFNKSTTWSFESRILPPTNIAVSASFGSAIAFNGTAIAIGAYLNDGGTKNLNAGTMYYYKNYTGALTLSLSGVGGSKYGSSIAMTSHSLFVGALAGGTNRTGVVSQYSLTNLNAFTAGTKITAGYIQFSQDSTADEFFGQAIATDGISLMVGAPAKSLPLDKNGAAYIYNVN
jgi:hypothetical protein